MYMYMYGWIYAYVQAEFYRGASCDFLFSVYVDIYIHMYS